jgi:hypothetical protein
MPPIPVPVGSGVNTNAEMLLVPEFNPLNIVFAMDSGDLASPSRIVLFWPSASAARSTVGMVGGNGWVQYRAKQLTDVPQS